MLAPAAVPPVDRTRSWGRRHPCPGQCPTSSRLQATKGPSAGLAAPLGSEDAGSYVLRAVLSAGQDHVLGVQSKDREHHVARIHVVLHIHHKVPSGTFNRTGNKPWITFSCTLCAGSARPGGHHQSTATAFKRARKPAFPADGRVKPSHHHQGKCSTRR